jgi:type IV pilus assembly protein PilY1
MNMLRSGLLAALTFLAVVAVADDTDIYLNAGLGGGGSGEAMVMMTLDLRPNLGSTECSNVLSGCEEHLGSEIFQHLDLVDSTGNAGADGVADYDQHDVTSLGVSGGSGYWSGMSVTMFDGMRAVFMILFGEFTDLRVGMMINHEDSCTGNPDAGPGKIPASSSSGCSNGAYVLKGFFDPEDTVQRADMMARLAAIPVPSTTVNGTTWNGHPFQIAELYFEYYRYITGQDLFNAWLGYESFNSKLPKKNLMDGGNDVDPLLAPDSSIYTGSGATASYTSPFAEGAAADWTCSKLYIVNTMDQVSSQSADSDFAISAAAPAGLAISSPTEDNVIAKLNDLDLASDTIGIDIEGDQTVTSYWVADNVNTKTNGYAAAGGTGTAYDHGDPRMALETLRSIFREILSVSTTFVAASVPVNVFNRAEVVDNVFLAIFEAQAEPRWPGNVKKLRIAELTTTNAAGEEEHYSVIQDADGDTAFDSDDGRIKTDALTYWTDAEGVDVVAFDADKNEVTGKDGRSVMRGGAGQRVPGILSDNEPGDQNADLDARQLFTENPATANELIPFDADSATASVLAPYLDPTSALSEDELESLISWARGIDAYDEDADTGDDSRDWMMGDPMHSRPLVINYGSVTPWDRDNPLIRLFFGSNDGWFRVVENTSGAGLESGEELFGFLPLELMGTQQRLAENNPTIADLHPYGVDGEAVAYVNDADSDGTIETGDDVWVYFGLRRGGKAYYAMDASDPDSTPTMKWKIAKSGEFGELGMTFSTPRVTWIQYAGTRVPALVFAGGYDGGWSGSDRIGKDAGWGDSSEGNAIYVVNADTGALIWKAVKGSGFDSNTVHYDANLLDAIPSTMTMLDADGNGITDRAYVGDSGGSLWRIDLPEGGDTDHRKDNWRVTRIARLGYDDVNNDRRFFHAPDVVKARDDTGDYIGIILTSGNRADPQNRDVENYLYVVKDREVTVGSTASLIVDETDGTAANDLPDITDICIEGGEAFCEAADLDSGWKLSLQANGEKGLAAPLTVNGTIYFTSYLPEGDGSSTTCAPSEGSGRLYAIRLKDGSVVFNLNNVIEGYDKADRYTSVGPGIPPGAKPLGDQILLPGTGIDGNQIIDAGGRSRWRVYWRDAGVDRL